MTEVDDILAHYGVKGQKWGVRKSESERSTPSTVKIKNKSSVRGAQDITVKARAGRGVTKTKGGARNVASKDAIETRATRQKARRSTTDALTNAELKKVTERMKLEQSYRKLQKEEPKIKRGKDFIKDFLGENGPKILALVG